MLSNEERELILASSVEFAELDTVDFSADVGGQFLDLDVAIEETREFGVCILAVLIGFEGLVGWILCLIPVLSPTSAKWHTFAMGFPLTRQIIGILRRLLCFRAVDLGVVIGRCSALRESLLVLALVSVLLPDFVGDVVVFNRSLDKCWSHFRVFSIDDTDYIA